MHSFLVEYIFYNEEGIPIRTSVPVLANDEAEARGVMKLRAFGCIEIISVTKHG